MKRVVVVVRASGALDPDKRYRKIVPAASGDPALQAQARSPEIRIFRPMYKLNLPAFDYKLRKADDKVWIFDGIRKKFVVLSPEEWVRQHFIHYLIDEKRYPRSLIRVEGGLLYNKLQKRTDIVVFNRAGVPWMVVECKAPSQKISDATLSQAAVYNSTLKAQFICVTNGMVHFCAEVEWTRRSTVSLEQLPAFPD